MTISGNIGIGIGFNEKHNLDKEHREKDLGYNKDGLIILKNESVKEVARRVLEPAIKEYNQRASVIHGGREKTFEDTFKNRKPNCEQEIIVSLGDHITTGMGSNNREKAEECLKAFFEKFQKEFPNYHVCSAAIHGDEKGAIHMHMDCLLYGKNPNPNRGLSANLIPSWAYQNMGISSRERTDADSIAPGRKILNAWPQLIEKSRRLLAEICEEKGLDVSFVSKENKIKHEINIKSELFKATMQQITKTRVGEAQEAFPNIQNKIVIIEGKEHYAIDKMDYYNIYKEGCDRDRLLDVTSRQVVKQFDDLLKAEKILSQGKKLLKETQYELYNAINKTVDRHVYTDINKEHDIEFFEEKIAELKSEIQALSKAITETIEKQEKIVDIFEQGTAALKEYAEEPLLEDEHDLRAQPEEAEFTYAEVSNDYDEDLEL